MTRPSVVPPPGEPVALADAEVPDFLDAHPLALLVFVDDAPASARLRERVAVVAAKLGRPGVGVGVVDVGRDRRVAMAVDVRGVPTTLVFAQGEVVDRVMGAAPVEILEQVLASRMPK